MNLTEPFILKADIVLIPCAELSDDLRARIAYDEGDVTLLHRHGRALMQVIDGETAALLRLFRQPRTISDAVIENSRTVGRSPEERLEELLPHLGRLLGGRVLVPAGSAEENEIRPRYEAGANVAGWTIVRCVSLAEDSEVYQLRRGDDVAALKIARIANAEMQAELEQEWTILRQLDGTGIAPAPICSGSDDGRPYVITSWIADHDVSVTAAQRRHDRAALIDLCASIAAAYAALHERGIVHGDVNWRNVLAGSSGLALVDFALARRIGEPPRTSRGIFTYFLEPEYLVAARQDVHLPASEAGEQYALAALLYFLVCGHHYIDFRFDHQEMMRQIECDPPLPFAARGVAPWPEVEEILARALQKDPSRRFGSIAEMAVLLAAVRDQTFRASLETPIGTEAAALLEATLRSFAPGGAAFASGYPIAPTASITFGCAGAAVGLLHLAEARSDPALLSLADVWRSRAAALIGTSGAFYNAEDGLPREILGELTPYHTEAGIHAAAAMIAAATGDVASQRQAVTAFLLASRRPCSEIDLTLGQAGSLLAASLLLPAAQDLPEADALRDFGAKTLGTIWSALDAAPVIGAAPGAPLSMAHGWTGYLYASLRWCTVSGDGLPPHLETRLRELASLRLPSGRGIFWPHRVGREADSPFDPSWCNGSAGQLFLFVLAHRLLGDREWLRLAELSAWNTWDRPATSWDLCCGGAGRAYALLNLYKHTGAAEWLGRARDLANHAAAATSPAVRRNALWKGEMGVAVLIADLAAPENARMPFFE